MRSSVVRVAGALCLLAAAACRREAAPPPPRRAAPLPLVSGTLPVDGVSQPVRIVRDRWGVPHIYAQNERDLFFAQGFVQAQDRLFQMDLWRRSVQGRLSEVLGPNFVERDAATRRVQYRGDIAAEWAAYGPDVKPIAEAFVRGVNAWVAIAREDPPEEFTLAGWRPELWRPEDLLNRTDAFLSSGDAALDVFRARLVAAVGERRADALLPAATPYKIPAGLDVNGVSVVIEDALRRVGTAPFFLGLAAPVAARPVSPWNDVNEVNPLNAFSPASRVPSGSNAWAVSGARSATRAPLVANDPHRAFAHPSLRYLVHLNAPGWNVIGATSPWLPGVVIGHNDRVAWGMTALPADTEDVYVERVNPANPHQVESRGRWVDTTVEIDPITIKGQAKPFQFEREITPHGFVVATDTEHHLEFVVRWSGSEAGAAGELGALALDRARSSAELLGSLARWKMPAVEVVYADVDGAVGRQAAGLVPIRTGWDGVLPAPGWTGTFEWKGWRSPEAMPHAAPSAAGVVVSVNQSQARTNRLAELFAGGRAYTTDDFRTFQHDTTAWNAEQLVPLVARLHADRSVVEDARQQLVKWDKRLASDSAIAALYVFWEQALLRKLAESRIPPVLLDDYLTRATVLVSALTRPSRAWFDGDPASARDSLLLEALAAAVDRERTLVDANRRAPIWGRLHMLTFKHPLAVTQAGRRRFNVGPFEQPGYADTVMSASSGLDVTAGASFREILDLADWDRSLATNAARPVRRPRQRALCRSGKTLGSRRLLPAGLYGCGSAGEHRIDAHATAALS